MKLKLLDVLTASLVTLAILYPGIIVFNLICGRHIELVNTQNLSCQVTKIKKGYNPLSLQLESINTPQFPANRKLSRHNFFVQLQILAEQYKIATILQWLVLFTPIGIGFGILGYDRYLVYRAAVLKAQVEMLERLWQQSIEQ
ncbi:hypothetical protein [Trichormus azollae]|jgi:ABC-type transport system involved in multi-copper enzyme maturation permease subunit|uniref:Uncharacterized protein n=1 Tax=Nostoc azollae (strain 0708) TaxID=551115 RepID=D7E2Y0_NOSA0|nr:hypothetical protein [Trichormus azollae]ADI65048.1 conserved hypothetical protein ['Nostoc azollae' 0708]